MNNTPPPDRGHLTTEQRLGASASIDAMSTVEALTVINDQDATIAGIVREKIPAIAALIDAIAQRMAGGGRLIYVGAGTSGRLGVLDASECPPTFHCDPGDVVGVIAGGDAALRRSSEGAEDDSAGPVAALDEVAVGERDVIVGLMAGGTTPYVWGALAHARRKGAATGLVCCVKLDDEARGRVDHPIELIVGPEVVTGSTRMKAGTATKLTLNMITTGVMIQRGKTWGNLMVDLRATNAKLRDRAARILSQQCELSRDAALSLLDRADGRVKTAIVMHRRGVDAEEANALLTAHAGQLRSIVGAPGDPGRGGK